MPRVMQVTILAILGISMLMKKAMVKIPVPKQSPYIAMWALIGFPLARRQITHPMKTRNKITAINSNNIYHIYPN